MPHPAGQVGWFKNVDGGGTFDVGLDISTTLNNPARLAVGNFTGDGHHDIVVASTFDRVQWFENSDGVFSLGAELEEQTPAAGAM